MRCGANGNYLFVAPKPSIRPTMANRQLIDDCVKESTSGEKKRGNKIYHFEINHDWKTREAHANGWGFFFLVFVCVWFTFSLFLSMSLLRQKQCEWSNELSRGQWKALLQCLYLVLARYVCIVRECEYDVWIKIKKKETWISQLLPICFFSLHYIAATHCATVAAIFTYRWTEAIKYALFSTVFFFVLVLFFFLSSFHFILQLIRKRKHCTNLQHIE